VYGKKTSVVVGSFVTLLGLGFLAFGSSFAAFAAGFILMGIGQAFRSGAESALLYDWLSSVGREPEYIRHQSRLRAAFVAIDIISGSVGFLLFALNVRIPFIISFAALALVIVVQFTLKDVTPRASRQENVFAVHIHQIKEGLSIVLRSRLILWLTGFTLIYSVFNMFFSTTLNLPFLQEAKGFTTDQLALMGLIWNTIQTGSLFFVSRLEARMGPFSSILVLVVLTPLLFLALFFSDSFIASAVIIGLYYSSMSFREVIIDTYLNTRISSQYRATVLSIASMVVSSFAIFSLPVLGLLVDRSSLNAGLLVLVLGTLILGPLSLLVRRRLGDP
jgi:MFS family permease